MATQEEIIAKLEALIAEAKNLASDLDREMDDAALAPSNASMGLCRKVRASAINILSVIGASTHKNELERCGNYDIDAMRGILEAAKEDLVGGFLLNLKMLLSSEIFEDFLEQANHFLELQYKDAAAIIIGAVLEDGLRKIAIANSVEFQSDAAIETLSRFLLKADVYNELVHKEVLAKAQIRNDAAHAKFDQYGIEDVKGFHAFVQRFLAEYMK